MIERVFMFAKAQVSSFIGGGTDYLIMIILTEFCGFHYTASISISGVVGAFLTFFLNKGWTFRSKEVPYKHSVSKQMKRFVVVVFFSIILKMSGTYFFTTHFRIDYVISRMITDFIVSMGISYTLQRHWVFKKEYCPTAINTIDDDNDLQQ